MKLARRCIIKLKLFDKEDFMNYVINAMNYVLSFEVYVMLPILMLIICMIVKMKFLDALKHSLTLGIGFFGIFMVFDAFVAKMGPVIEIIAEKSGQERAILDVGWPPLAAAAWTFRLVPILIILFILINALMLMFKWTNTINIDIWNFWHFIFVGQMVFYTSGNLWMAGFSAILSMILVLKFGDWSAPRAEEMTKIPGIAITTLTGVCYYPYALAMDWILSRIPVIKKINGNPEHIRERFGFFGDPMFIGLIIGTGLGIAADYDFKETANLGISVMAVVFLLPRMAGILGEGLMPISEETKKYILTKFPTMHDARIGMDLAVVIGNPATIATGILVMPMAVILSLILPGVDFIPVGDLPNLIPAGAFIVIAMRGNIFRSVISYIPIIIGHLYFATALSGFFTKITLESEIRITNFNGNITSFLDGGNLFRNYLHALFTGSTWAYMLVPIMLVLVWIAYRSYKKDELHMQESKKTV